MEMNSQEQIDSVIEIVKEVYNKVKEILEKFTTFFNKIYANVLKYGTKRTKRIAHLALHSKKYRVRKKNFKLLFC